MKATKRKPRRSLMSAWSFKQTDVRAGMDVDEVARNIRKFGAVKVASVMGGLPILQGTLGGYPAKEVLEIGTLIPLLEYKGKSDNNEHLRFLQTGMNAFLHYVFTNQYGGYTDEVVFRSSGLGENRVDFFKEFLPNLRVVVEIEFGNVASGDRDLKKFRQAWLERRIDLAILIIPTKELGKGLDSGVASFEKIVAEILTDKNLDFPMVVIGLDMDPSKVVDVSQLGFSLDALKSSSKSTEKFSLAQKVWDMFSKPNLGPDSVHARYLEQVKANGGPLPRVRPPVGLKNREKVNNQLELFLAWSSNDIEPRHLTAKEFFPLKFKKVKSRTQVRYHFESKRFMTGIPCKLQSRKHRPYEFRRKMAFENAVLSWEDRKGKDKRILAAEWSTGPLSIARRLSSMKPVSH